jgi:pyruvate/2-oxoglutarate dehydrogenase complex dihydrolipoamide acyltransferase (E2) component
VLLKVKLERILGTIDRALSAIEQNPGLLDDRMREEGGDVAEIEGSVAEPGPQESEEPATQVEATTAARRKAEELGVDLSRIQGSGAGGRVLVRDVREAAG